MRGFILFIAIVFFYNTGFGQSHGLEFSSHEVMQEKRTALNLAPTAPFCPEENASISFDFNFRPNLDIYFGYIMRIITSEQENIDLVYNQKLRNFNFVIGEAFSAVFQIDSAKLYGQWTNVSVKFNKASNESSFFLNNKFIGKGKARLGSKPCFKVYFGACDHEGFQTVDIPPMNIRDIKIEEDGKEVSNFPLLENEGSLAADSKSKRTAVVKNGTWIKPKHQNWQLVHTFDTKAAASVAFDQENETVYIVSTDTLYSYSVKYGQSASIRYAKRHDSLPPGNQSVFDTLKNKLLNINIDQQKVSAWNPESRSWNMDFPPGALTVYWQANKFISALDSALYVFGGYGQLQYRNSVQRYNASSGNWEMIEPHGDSFMPRYLAGLGANSNGDTAFIIGGYGSTSGEQTINPKNNYDLLAFSIRDKSFHRIYHLKEPAKPFCFANSLVIDQSTNSFYGLTFPNDRFNSTLQLIRGSLQEPHYELVGDSIPYFFYDIKSFADLFYAPATQKLVAVTLYTEKNGITAVKIFTIDFPPNQLVSHVPLETSSESRWLYAIVGLLLLGGGLAYYSFASKKKRQKPGQQQQEKEKEKVKVKGEGMINEVVPVAAVVDEIQPQSHNHHRPVSSVYLFGQFEVFDKEGVDITSRFTPLIRELFLLMLIYTYKDGKGISSEQLYDILWSDKPVKDARNNYSVNVVKLKHILEKAGDCHFTKESGKWKMEVLNDSIKIDFQQFSNLMSGQSALSRTYINELLSIIGRGGLLSAVHYNWLDDVKSSIAGEVIDLLLKFLHTTDPISDAELISRVANAVFYFDQLNEEALVYKCRASIALGRHGLAKEAYLKFSKEYQENYGQPFERSFADISQAG